MADEGEVAYLFQYIVETINDDGRKKKEVKSSNAPCIYTADKKVIPYTGEAVVRYTNRDTFEGSYKDGKKNGKGVYRYYSTTDKYDG